jgi:hypothetical protein
MPAKSVGTRITSTAAARVDQPASEMGKRATETNSLRECGARWLPLW